MLNVSRRGFLTGLATLVAAPAIVRVASIMPVRPLRADLFSAGYPLWEVYGGKQVFSEDHFKDAIAYTMQNQPGRPELVWCSRSFLDDFERILGRKAA